MAEPIKVSKKEEDAYKRKVGQVDKVDTLVSSVQKLNRQFGRIVRVWDGTVCVIGTILSIIIAVLITYFTRSLYYSAAAKWAFSTVFLGGIVFVCALFILLFIQWLIMNLFLHNKIFENEEG